MPELSGWIVKQMATYLANGTGDVSKPRAGKKAVPTQRSRCRCLAKRSRPTYKNQLRSTSKREVIMNSADELSSKTETAKTAPYTTTPGRIERVCQPPMVALVRTVSSGIRRAPLVFVTPRAGSSTFRGGPWVALEWVPLGRFSTLAQMDTWVGATEGEKPRSQ